MFLALALAAAPALAADSCPVAPLSIAAVETAIPAFTEVSGLDIQIGVVDLAVMVSSSGAVRYAAATDWIDATGHYDFWSEPTVQERSDGSLLVSFRDTTPSGEAFAARLVVAPGAGGAFVAGTVTVGLFEGCYKYEIYQFAPVGRVTVLRE